MLQATIYAHRSAIDGIARVDVSARAPARSAGPAFSRLLVLGLALLRGKPDEALSDHLLDDIGLSRADLDALAL